MNMIDMTITVLVAKPALHNNDLQTIASADGETKSPVSWLRRAARAVVAFWDNGGSSVDALYASKFGNQHFLESNGVTFQYYGDISAFRPARILRLAEVQGEYRTLRRIVGAEDGFAPAANGELRRRAS